MLMGTTLLYQALGANFHGLVVDDGGGFVVYTASVIRTYHCNMYYSFAFSIAQST